MAEQKTVDKVKELLQGHCYEPLKEAAEKWLDEADAKYDVKDKADKAKDKLSEVAGSAKDIGDDVIDKAKDFGDDVLDKAKDVIGDENFDKIKDFGEDVIDKAKDLGDDVFDKAKDFGEDIAGKAKGAGEKAAESELIAQLKEGISTVKENIEFFGSDEAKEKFGEEAAAQIKKHAEELQAQGKTYCDCEACTKAREILKDLGEDIGE